MKPIVLVGCTKEFQERVVAEAGEGLQGRLRRWSDPLARDGTLSGLLTYDPAVVVLGGDIAEMFQPLVSGVREVIYQRPDDRPVFTWNLMPVPVDLVPGA